MAKHSVDILIKARDEASKAMGTVGKSVLSMTGFIKKAAAVMAVYFSGRMIKDFAVSSVDAFAESESAVQSLSDALDLLGQGGNAAIKDLLKFASGIQAVTKYEDDAVVGLMALGASMGQLSGDALKDAAKAAIGFAAAYKMELKAAMTLVSKAANGNTAAFARYGVILDGNLSKQEKYNEVLKIGIRNFKLAEGEVNTYRGAVQQMKNALGDVKEAIGEALMPMFKKSAERIKKWAEDNAEAIGKWSKKVVSYIELGKDIFMAFADFLLNDWKNAVSFAFNTFLTLMETAFKSAVTLAIAGGKGIWEGVKAGLMGDDTKILKERIMRLYHEDPERQPLTPPLIVKGGRKHSDYYYELQKKAKQQLLQEKTGELMGDSMQVIGKQWKDMIAEIGANMPKSMAKQVEQAFADNKKRLSEPSWYNLMIRNLINQILAGNKKRFNNESFSMDLPHNKQNSMNGLGFGFDSPAWQAREARFLTIAPGSRLNKTEDNTTRMVRQLEQTNKHLASVDKKTSNNSINDGRYVLAEGAMR